MTAQKPLVLLKQGGDYGNVRYYPVNKTAEIFCKIAKALTLTKANIALIKELGYEIQVEQVEL